MLVPVILSGGSGSRLWPLSREGFPKPFVRFDNTHSLLQLSYLRAFNIPQTTQILTVTNLEYYYQTQQELLALSFNDKKKNFHFLLEPVAKNTASAMSCAALFTESFIAKNAVLLTLPADHWITDLDRFNECVQQAYYLAQQNYLVTFGITPDKPNTRYGYIEYLKHSSSNHFYFVKRFREKPNIKEANFFLAQGNFFWNAGIFCFSVTTFLNMLQKYNAAFFNQIQHCWQETINKHCFKKKNNAYYLDRLSFSQLNEMPIEPLIMEKAQNLVVIPSHFGWSDMGSWDALDNLLEADRQKNRTLKPALLKDTKNVTIYNTVSEKQRLIATLNVKNLLIADTEDALLIVDKTKTEGIRDLVDSLKDMPFSSQHNPGTIYRPWGTYTVLAHEGMYKLKRIIVNPHSNLSLQVHYRRSEHWVVVQGIATVEINKKTFNLKEGESTFIAIGHEHRLRNLTSSPTIIIELQLGKYLEEDDIIRLEDDYDRADKLNTPQEHEIDTC